MAEKPIMVLYIDDEADLTEYLPLVLEAEGFEITGETDIAKALAKVSTHKYDVVLIDVMMPPPKDVPEMDDEKVNFGRTTGIEVIKRIRLMKKDLPIVAFTVLTEESDRQDILLSGATRIINKPSELARIADILRQAVKSST